MKRLLLGVGLLVVFTAGVLATFPTQRLVDALLTRLPAATTRRIEHIGSSRLGLRGLTLENVTLRVHAGAPALALEEVSLRPSVLGLLVGRSGRPWQARATACGGTATVHLDRESRGDTIALQFDGLDLATCLVPFEPTGPVEGRATGTADFVVAGDDVDGRGSLALRAVRWRPPGVPRHVPLHAEEATLGWTFDEQTFRVDDFAMTNDEFAATARGVIRFPRPRDVPQLDLRIHLQPTATMPQAHRDLLSRLRGSPPDATGGRTYRIAGPLDAPVLEAP
jgi:type II secretion system protein N